MNKNSRQQLGVVAPDMKTGKKTPNEQKAELKELSVNKHTGQLGVERHIAQHSQQTGQLKTQASETRGHAHEIEFIDEGHELTRMEVDSSDLEKEFLTNPNNTASNSDTQKPRSTQRRYIKTTRVPHTLKNR